MVAAAIQWADRIMRKIDSVFFQISAEHRTVQCSLPYNSEPGKVLDFNGLLHTSPPRP
jgi:hypothetical protein